MKLPTLKILKGFIATPIILSLVFSVLAGIYGLCLSTDEHEKFSLFCIAVMGWFLHSFPVALIIIVLVGLPSYLCIIKLGYSSLKQYIVSGLMLGALLPLALLFWVQPIEWWLFVFSASFGVLASYVFWQISIKP